MIFEAFFKHNAIVSPIASIVNSVCEECGDCSGGEAAVSLPFQELPFLWVVFGIAILLLVKKNKLQVLFWALGISVFIALAASLASDQLNQEQFNTEVHTDSFQQETETSEFFDETQAIDLGINFDDDEISVGDAFDEFEEFDEFSEGEDQLTTKSSNAKLIRILIALFATVIAGVVVRYNNGRNVRNIFLLSSLIYLGFYSGGCSCMISSFQNVILFLMGESTEWVNLIWFLGLIPITYFFGKVWCGWICHLGALQEFLYRPKIAKRMNKPKVQQVLKTIRMVALVALLVQLLVTKTNLFIKIDPFKVVFNLFSVNISGYVLLVILLVSSLFVYRPFCKTLCPVGLVLGWIQKIPGASKLVIQSSCKKCNKCVKNCDCQAISTVLGEIKIDNGECIRCGDCLDGCNDIKIGNRIKIDGDESIEGK